MQSPNPKLFMYINDRIVLMLIKQRQVHWKFKKKKPNAKLTPPPHQRILLVHPVYTQEILGKFRGRHSIFLNKLLLAPLLKTKLFEIQSKGYDSKVKYTKKSESCWILQRMLQRRIQKNPVAEASISCSLLCQWNGEPHVLI